MRERGGAAKLREAMKAIRKEVYLYAIEEDNQDFAHLHEAMLDNPPEYKDLRDSFLAIAHLVDAALAAPPRNCEVGTVEEQSQKFDAFCDANKYVGDDGANWCSRTCPCYNDINCGVDWAQMPYEEGGAK